MTDRELFRQALEALEMLARYENPETRIQVRKPKDGGPIVTMYPHKVSTDAANALRTAIAEAEKQEPVAWMYVNMDGECEQIEYLENEPLPDDPSITPLYTAPQSREWVGLTEEEVEDLEFNSVDQKYGHLDVRALSHAIEAKLREKNA